MSYLMKYGESILAQLKKKKNRKKKDIPVRK